MNNIRIGRITLALTFIALGVVVFLDRFTSLSLKDTLFLLWPLIAITLGIEIITGSLFSRRDHTKAKLDLLSIIFIIVLIVVLGAFDLGTRYFLPHYRFSSEIAERIELDEDKRIIVNEDNIDIDVVRGSGEKAVVKLEGVYRHNDSNLSHDLLEIEKHSDGTLITRKDTKKRVRFMKMGESDIKYTLELPKGIDLEIFNGYGDVSVRDIEGDVSIRAESSDVLVKDVVGNVDIIGGYGDIMLGEVLGDISIKSNSSDVLVETNEMRNVDIENEYGDVSLKIPKSQKGKFKIVTNFGDITDDLGFDIIESASGSSINEVRNSPNPILNIKVESGDVNLESSD